MDNVRLDFLFLNEFFTCKGVQNKVIRQLLKMFGEKCDLTFFRSNTNDTIPPNKHKVDGRNPANQLRLVVYPVFSGFYTFQVVHDFFHINISKDM